MEITTVAVTAKARELTAKWTVSYDNMFTKEFYIRKAYHGEWAIEVPFSKWREVVDWCSVAFGADGNNRRYRWRKNNLESVNRIFLRNEADLMLFKLKWYGQ